MSYLELLKELCSADNDLRINAINNTCAKAFHAESQLSSLEKANFLNILSEIPLKDSFWKHTLIALSECIPYLVGDDKLRNSIFSLRDILIDLLHQDKDVRIRRVALDILGCLLQVQGENESQTSIFIAIGKAINDTDKFIRAQACELLATAKLTQETLLLQLLSKEALPLGPDQDKAPWEFCGSFIIALEDEHELVRKAAVKAISKISCWPGTDVDSFKWRALPFLLDSTQDESESVRIVSMNAITCVLSHHEDMLVDGDLLNQILAHLDDVEAGAREAAFKMLALTRVKSLDALLQVLRRLSPIFDKFTVQRNSLVDATFKFGRVNYELVGSSILRLLKVDKFFVPAVPRIEDSSYIIRLITILASLYQQSAYNTSCPYFVRDHFHYLRLAYPTVIPSFYRHELSSFFYPVLKSVSTLDTIKDLDLLVPVSSNNHDAAKKIIKSPMFSDDQRSFLEEFYQITMENCNQKCFGSLAATFTGFGSDVIASFLKNEIPKSLNASDLHNVAALKATIRLPQLQNIKAKSSLCCHSQFPLSVIIQGTLNSKPDDSVAFFALIESLDGSILGKEPLILYQENMLTCSMLLDCSQLPLNTPLPFTVKIVSKVGEWSATIGQLSNTIYIHRLS